MSSPTNKKQVKSFIGIINYLAKFSARLSEFVESIRDLAKDKVPFNWSSEYQQAFIHIKKEIASALVLAYYNLRRQTILQTDASIKGLVLIYYKIKNQCILQARILQMPRNAML